MRFIRLAALIGATLSLIAGAAAGDEPTPRVRLETTMGDIVIELDAARAPATVDNFLTYVNDGFYDGTIFHRVIDDFMIQGGGFTADMSRKQTRAPINNEAANGLKNTRGTIAMARTRDPHSATAQFFINVADNPALDYTAPDARGWGYTVFGHVVEGMEVVDRIRAQPTGVRGRYRDVPESTITITRAVVEGAGS
ncbi:MAG: peptidylprolyl isomerase [Gammaproteobacteria bacterium]|nr:peptidylprolyl isomerase [Gammaproteobacteria bacterium]